MTTLPRRRQPDRYAHQRTVAALLDQLEERRRRLYLLKTAGVGPAALHELKTELHELRQALATAVADKATPPPRPGRRGCKPPTPSSALPGSVAKIENPPTTTIAAARRRPGSLGARPSSRASPMRSPSGPRM